MSKAILLVGLRLVKVGVKHFVKNEKASTLFDIAMTVAIAVIEAY